MGKGSSTRQIGVIKQLEEFTSSGSQASSSSQHPDSSCLFSFKIEEIINDSQVQKSIRIGDKAAIIMSATSTDKLDLYVGSSIINEYNGNFKKRIIKCLKKGYVYEGLVTSLLENNGGLKVIIDLSGYGKAHE